jgi:hypothetical protein
VLLQIEDEKLRKAEEERVEQEKKDREAKTKKVGVDVSWKRLNG